MRVASMLLLVSEQEGDKFYFPKCQTAPMSNPLQSYGDYVIVANMRFSINLDFSELTFLHFVSRSIEKKQTNKKQTLTMFSRLKSHHNPSRSIHQTSSHIQILRQHDLKKSEQKPQTEHSSWHISRDRETRKEAYLSSHFELDQSADGAVSVYSLHQGWVTVQCLKHTHWPYRTGRDSFNQPPQSLNTLSTVSWCSYRTYKLQESGRKWLQAETENVSRGNGFGGCHMWLNPAVFPIFTWIQVKATPARAETTPMIKQKKSHLAAAGVCSRLWAPRRPCVCTAWSLECRPSRSDGRRFPLAWRWLLRSPWTVKTELDWTSPPLEKLFSQHGESAP